MPLYDTTRWLCYFQDRSLSTILAVAIVVLISSLLTAIGISTLVSTIFRPVATLEATLIAARETALIATLIAARETALIPAGVSTLIATREAALEAALIFAREATVAIMLVMTGVMAASMSPYIPV